VFFHAHLFDQDLFG
jgi:hypothetical protein